MESQLPRQVAANPTQYNIDAIAKLEHDALNRRTLTERASDIILKVVGNIGFPLAQLIFIFVWCLLNLHVIPGLKAFDPFPFGVLALVASSRPKRTISAAGRKRIAAAQRARWARVRAAKKPA
jgi:uncharacterized membrane protein